MALQDDLTAERAAQPVKAIVIHCPRCLVQHIDEGQWLLIKHHTHQCQSCGYEFDVGYYSVGVDLAKTARQEALREAAEEIERFIDYSGGCVGTENDPRVVAVNRFITINIVPLLNRLAQEG